ncbi:hypothetical protein DFJ73DRAFT_964449 [Zopfochytrium polystomum]|nr:hypothetical protein DFJ73DRAFT_964449 [Zopfochytrium polystomum]
MARRRAKGLKPASKPETGSASTPTAAATVTNEHLESYKKKVEKLIADATQTLETFRKYDADYEKLDKFLEETPKKLKADVKVPIGPLAFMQGELIHTNEVIVSLGANWFMECSASHAREIVARRREYSTEQMVAAKEKIENLNLRRRLAEGSATDLDGDAVNEEGLKFVEIREEMDDDGNIISERPAAPPVAEPQPPRPPQTAPTPQQAVTPRVSQSDAVAAAIDEFDQKLLDLIEKLGEEEERHGLSAHHGPDDDGDGNASEQDSDDARLRAQEEEEYQQYDSGLRADDDEDDFNPSDPEPASDDDDDHGDEREAGEGGRRAGRRRRNTEDKVKARRKSVSFAEDVKPVADDEDDGGSGGGGSGAPSLPPLRHPGDVYHRMLAVVEHSRQSVDRKQKAAETALANAWQDILKDAVVVHDELDDFTGEDLEDYLFGREIAEEYHQKRESLLEKQANVVDYLDDEARERLHFEELERTGSRFKARRLVATAASNAPAEDEEDELIDQEVLAYAKLQLDLEDVLPPEQLPPDLRETLAKSERLALSDQPQTSIQVPDQSTTPAPSQAPRKVKPNLAAGIRKTTSSASETAGTAATNGGGTSTGERKDKVEDLGKIGTAGPLGSPSPVQFRSEIIPIPAARQSPARPPSAATQAKGPLSSPKKMESDVGKEQSPGRPTGKKKGGPPENGASDRGNGPAVASAPPPPPVGPREEGGGVGSGTSPGPHPPRGAAVQASVRERSSPEIAVFNGPPPPPPTHDAAQTQPPAGGGRKVSKFKAQRLAEMASGGGGIRAGSDGAAGFGAFVGLQPRVGSEGRADEMSGSVDGQSRDAEAHVLAVSADVRETPGGEVRREYSAAVVGAAAAAAVARPAVCENPDVAAPPGAASAAPAKKVSKFKASRMAQTTPSDGVGGGGAGRSPPPQPAAAVKSPVPEYPPSALPSSSEQRATSAPSLPSNSDKTSRAQHQQPERSSRGPSPERAPGGRPADGDNGNGEAAVVMQAVVRESSGTPAALGRRTEGGGLSSPSSSSSAAAPAANGEVPRKKSLFRKSRESMQG